MRELERDFTDTPERALPRSTVADERALVIAIVGHGRLGRALAAALREAQHIVLGPFGRGEGPSADRGEGPSTERGDGPSTARGDGAPEPDAVLLCVPDGEIAAAAAAIEAGPLVGHCSGATGLEVLALHESFSIHPLMTVTSAGAEFAGAGAAVAGSTPGAVAFAEKLAATLGLRSARIAEQDRAAYHAAASIASNFLITLEAAAEELAATVGVTREQLVPLVRATVENWASLGPAGALTGPIARGDELTVMRQRQAVAKHAPRLIDLFDSMADATRSLALRPDDPRA